MEEVLNNNANGDAPEDGAQAGSSQPRRKPAIGEVFELDIADAAYGGDGVGRHNGIVVMVRDALPGDRVECVVVKRKKRHVEARIQKVIGEAAHRVSPRCSHAMHCGGCSWQHLDYAKQLEAKESQVREHLRRIGGIEEPNLLPIAGMDEPWRYRNKMEYAFYAMNDGGIRLGLHGKGRFDYVFDVEDCYLHSENCNAIRNAALEYFRGIGAVAYHLKFHSGNLRHLVLRSVRGAKGVMAVLCAAEDEIPGVEGFVELLTARFPEVESIIKYRNTNKGGTSIAGEGTLLHGAESLTEEISGVKLEVSAESFMQTNTAQAEKLYSVMMEMCDLQGSETVLDLYTGAGPIALLVSGKAGRVIGIESVDKAVADAKRNAAANGIENVEFVHGEVEKLLGDVIAETKPQAVIVDPPRVGLHKNALAAIAGASPEKLVYVSCNPSTLARDAAALVEAGYRLEAVRPVDMFPHTYHIECVARFVK